jgi:hypothetical protein
MLGLVSLPNHEARTIMVQPYFEAAFDMMRGSTGSQA